MVLQRGDDAELSEYLARELSTPENPCVFCRGNFFRYNDETGIWDLLHEQQVRLRVTALAGTPYITDTEIDEDGKTLLITKALRVNEGCVRGTTALTATRLFTDDAFFDDPRAGVCFRNGFLTVETSGTVRLLDHSPDHRIRCALPFAYREDAPCPRWMRFLGELWGDHEEGPQKIACLQEFLGTTLIGNATTFDAALILLGSSAGNGKSTLLDTIECIFPPSVRSSIPPQRWGHEYHRAELDGKLFNRCGELPKTKIVDSEAFKDIISGGDIDARRPSERPFRYRAKAGHIFAANELPSTSDTTRGFFRRWRILELTRTFDGSDTEEKRDRLVAEMRAEAAGIAAWAIQGAARMMTQSGYTAVSSSTTTVAEWQRSGDAVAVFVHEMCSPAPDDNKSVWCQAMPLYRAFSNWCLKTGRKDVEINETEFGTRLTKLGYGHARTGRGRVRPLILNNQAPPFQLGAPPDVDEEAFPESAH